jgi:hypothetical protein
MQLPQPLASVCRRPAGPLPGRGWPRERQPSTDGHDRVATASWRGSRSVRSRAKAATTDTSGVQLGPQEGTFAEQTGSHALAPRLPPAATGRCPEQRVEELMGQIWAAVGHLQRLGCPDGYTRRGILAPVSWSVFPAHRVQLTVMWAELGLDVQAVEVFAAAGLADRRRSGRMAQLQRPKCAPSGPMAILPCRRPREPHGSHTLPCEHGARTVWRRAGLRQTLCARRVESRFALPVVPRSTRRRMAGHEDLDESARSDGCPRAWEERSVMQIPYWASSGFLTAPPALSWVRSRSRRERSALAHIQVPACGPVWLSIGAPRRGG